MKIVNHSSKKLKTNNGFTLLEILIAIAIFAVISLSSFTIFNTVLDSDESSRTRNERLNQLNRAFIIIERDFLQLARRSVRLNGEAPIKGFVHTDQKGLSTDTQAIGFVRGGWTNPSLLLPRSDMQSVAYKVEDNTLQRLHFNFVDVVVGQEPKIRPLITNVNGVEFEFYTDFKWQTELSSDKVPAAIAIIIDTKDFGIIRRQFLIPGDKMVSTS